MVLLKLISIYNHFQLKVYTDQQEARNFKNNIGFTTPSNTVSTNIKLAGQDVIIVNLYSLVMCFIYAVCVRLFFKHYFPYHRNEISTFIRDNNELIGGLTITTVAAVAVEIVARFINCALWSANINDVFDVLIPVWLPQGYILFMGTFVNIYYHIKFFINRDKGSKYIYNLPSFFLSNSINAHLILPPLLTVYGLVYTSFPAFILTLTYPNQMIAIISTLMAFLFASVIYSAITIRVYKQSITSTPKELWKRTIKFVVYRCLPSYGVAAFLKSILVVLLYLLTVSRGSVINAGPLVILSILPSVAVSSLSWIAKKKLLNKKNSSISYTKIAPKWQ